MEGIDGHLGHEQQQKNSGDLKEASDVNQMSELRPRPGHAAGSGKSEQGAPDETRAADLQEHQRGFHAFAADGHGREKKNSYKCGPPGALCGNLAQLFFHFLFQLRSDAPHVNDQRRDHHDRYHAEDTFAQRFVAEKPGDRLAKVPLDHIAMARLHLNEQVTKSAANTQRHRDGPVDGGRELPLPGFAQIRKNDRDQKEGFEAFAKNDDERLKHK